MFMALLKNTQFQVLVSRQNINSIGFKVCEVLLLLTDQSVDIIDIHEKRWLPQAEFRVPY